MPIDWFVELRLVAQAFLRSAVLVPCPSFDAVSSSTSFQAAFATTALAAALTATALAAAPTATALAAAAPAALAAFATTRLAPASLACLAATRCVGFCREPSDWGHDYQEELLRSLRPWIVDDQTTAEALCKCSIANHDHMFWLLRIQLQHSPRSSHKHSFQPDEKLFEAPHRVVAAFCRVTKPLHRGDADTAVECSRAEGETVAQVVTHDLSAASGASWALA
eukprot:CAMPEP_0115832800 /NCGR_PEP_ID=MMETSP0287-20121206/2845_1 /TAXON_ID=412157 /ORGANISM="Chrysochromulina rotalis, Strain UIO044" /LENGTH=222 /DNA_ID=CAMNT_0003286197 /DNA_START=87 /DNA_END=756 /DNA_ORIENTATION=-